MLQFGTGVDIRRWTAFTRGDGEFDRSSHSRSPEWFRDACDTAATWKIAVDVLGQMLNSIRRRIRAKRDWKVVL